MEEVKDVIVREKIDSIDDLMVFNRDALRVIEHTPLFNQEEKLQLMQAAESMEKAFFNSQIFRTETEAVISVLNDVRFPTAAAKYYQCLRELNVHQCELMGLLYDYESKQEDIRIIKAEIMELEEKLAQAEKDYEKIKLEAEINKKLIELRRIKFMLKGMKRTAEGRKQEIMQWDKLIRKLEPELIENGIPIDDVNAHQKISYTVRFIKEAVAALTARAEFSSGEAMNLFGQLNTALTYAIKENYLQAVVNHLSPLEVKFLVDYGVLELPQGSQPAELQNGQVDKDAQSS